MFPIPASGAPGGSSPIDCCANNTSIAFRGSALQESARDANAGETMRQAIVQSIVANNSSLITNLLTVIIASHFLLPEEAGAYTVCLSLITVISTIAEFNITNYGINATAVNDGELSSMLGLSLTIAICTVAPLYLLSVPISNLLGGPRTLNIYTIMIPSMLFSPFAVPKLALLRRNIQYGLIMNASLAASGVRALAGVLLLALGWGPESLAISYTLSKFLEAAIVIIFASGPTFIVPTIRGWGRIFGFSLLNTVSQAAGTIGFSIAEIATGHFLGLHYAGLYNRGSTLTSVYRTGVERSIYPIAFAALSRESQRPGGNVVRSYVTSIAMMTGVGWPAFAGLFILAPQIVSILFGAGWTEAADVTKILSVATAIYIFSSLSPTVLMATGNSQSLLKRELVVQGLRVVVVLFGTRFGIHGVAAAVLLTYAFAAALDFLFLKMMVGLTLRDLWEGSKNSLVVAGCVSICAVGMEQICGLLGAPSLVTCCAVAAAGAAAWLASVLLSGHILREEIIRVQQRLWRRRERES